MQSGLGQAKTDGKMGNRVLQKEIPLYQEIQFVIKKVFKISKERIDTLFNVLVNLTLVWSK